FYDYTDIAEDAARQFIEFLSSKFPNANTPITIDEATRAEVSRRANGIASYALNEDDNLLAFAIAAPSIHTVVVKFKDNVTIPPNQVRNKAYLGSYWRLRSEYTFCLLTENKPAATRDVYTCLCRESYYLPNSTLQGFRGDRVELSEGYDNYSCIPCPGGCSNCDNNGVCLTFQEEEVLNVDACLRLLVAIVLGACILCCVVLGVIVFRQRKCKAIASGMWTVLETILLGIVLLYASVAVHFFPASTEKKQVFPQIKNIILERQFLVTALTLEFLVSSSFYFLRFVYLPEMSPSAILLALFIRSQLTNSFALGLIFVPKLWYQHKQVRSLAYDLSIRLPVDAFKGTSHDAGQRLGGGYALYTQLEIMKSKTLRQDNPHISKRRGGRKAGHRRFSLQKKGSKDKALSAKHRSNKHHQDIEITEAEPSRTPEDSVCSAEGPTDTYAEISGVSHSMLSHSMVSHSVVSHSK
uniref:Probable G-protein coupled receptor 179 n=1 Tax=Drosophila rhopaloa TaxID=1041015 RepID=A0A6P4FQD6_DRORH